MVAVTRDAVTAPSTDPAYEEAALDVLRFEYEWAHSRVGRAYRGWSKDDSEQRFHASLLELEQFLNDVQAEPVGCEIGSERHTIAVRARELLGTKPFARGGAR